MNAETQREDGARPEGLLRLVGEMTIYQAGELKPLLLGCFEQGAGLALDMSAVTEIDTAGLQLLVASRKTAQERGASWRVTAASDAVVEVVTLLGMEESFGELQAVGMQAVNMQAGQA